MIYYYFVYLFRNASDSKVKSQCHVPVLADFFLDKNLINLKNVFFCFNKIGNDPYLSNNISICDLIPKNNHRVNNQVVF